MRSDSNEVNRENCGQEKDSSLAWKQTKQKSRERKGQKGYEQKLPRKSREARFEAREKGESLEIEFNENRGREREKEKEQILRR
jgi:hypothetical protein